jgi:hypothetical protein
MHMKKYVLMIFILSAIFGKTVLAQTVVVTDDPNYTTGDASAVMEVKSSSGGFLLPRMTQAERVAISNPAQGLLVYQTDGSIGFYQYDGSAWSLLTASSSPWSASGSDIYFNTGNIGVGTSSPSSTMMLSGSFSIPLTTQGSTYTITNKDYTVLCNAGSMTVNLPSASTAPGRVYVIKKISSSAGSITIDPNGAETIDGALTNTELVNQWSSMMIQSNGSNWFILSKSL